MTTASAAALQHTRPSVADLIEAALAGRRDWIRAEGGEIGEKLLRLADPRTVDDETQLKRWVEISITANTSVRRVAEMTRSVREVDSRT